MKTLLSILLIHAALAVQVPGSETNVVYLPLDVVAHVGRNANERAYAEQMEAAKSSPESRPAELDPEGHWGAIVCGFQLGIRFSTNAFAVGVPIKATVVVRNTTTNSLNLLAPQADSIHLVMTNISENLLPRLPKKLTFSGPVSLSIPEHRQIRYFLDVDQAFNLTAAGTYHIIAKRLVQAEVGGTNVELSSAVAEFNVVSPPESGNSSSAKKQ